MKRIAEPKKGLRVKGQTEGGHVSTRNPAGRLSTRQKETYLPSPLSLKTTREPKLLNSSPCTTSLKFSVFRRMRMGIIFDHKNDPEHDLKTEWRTKRGSSPKARPWTRALLAYALKRPWS
ncbi:hypothetical protein TNCV_5076561 [Trichonephila clavipes]|uniref:Uncharacterized protein n=1 Tax=Trichonephila clavipes TaxID=2585209 RepID=A0A8X6V6J9_TRICX|nr:hypothetical protein TNCV_5076561 [Trichonephila clavipes]